MQTVLDSNLLALSMFGLISKNHWFMAKLNFCKKKTAYGLGQDISLYQISCSQ